MKVQKNKKRHKNIMNYFAMLMVISLILGDMHFTGNYAVVQAQETKHNNGGKEESETVSAVNLYFDAKDEYREYTLHENDRGLLMLENYDVSEGMIITSITWTTDDESIIRITEADENTLSAGYEALRSGWVNICADVSAEQIDTGIENDDDDDDYDDDDDDYDGYYSTYREKLYFDVYVYPDMSKTEILNASQTKYMSPYDYDVKFDFKFSSELVLDEENSNIDFSYKSSDSSMRVSASLEDNILSICAYKAGETTVTISVYGVEMDVKIKVVKIEMNKYSLLVVKGKSANLKIKGVSKKAYNKIKWKSTDASVVKVTKKGKVKALKQGNAVITATIDGNMLGCAVSVVTPKINNVIKTAKSIAKGEYSQAKRMEKGYYDCSSLVWRSYSKYGTYFGMKNYAPVSADLCKWCVTKGTKVTSALKESHIQNMKLNAGDLIFKTGAKNGRYKGVYHVEMFTGYICVGFTSKGKPVLSTNWANRSAFYYAIGSIVARP